MADIFDRMFKFVLTRHTRRSVITSVKNVHTILSRWPYVRSSPLTISLYVQCGTNFGNNHVSMHLASKKVEHFRKYRFPQTSKFENCGKSSFNGNEFKFTLRNMLCKSVMSPSLQFSLRAIFRPNSVENSIKMGISWKP